MKLAGSIALFHYWNQLRNGRSAPRRTEIEPADIKKLLADTFILEKDLRSEAVFRLAGTRLCTTYGRELKGFGFSLLWRKQDRHLVGEHTQSVFDDHKAMFVSYRALSRTGRKLAFELLALPLISEAQNQRCLGIVTSAHKPFWLGAEPIVDAIINDIKIIDPQVHKTETRKRPAIEPPALVPDALDAASGLAGYGKARRIRHLLVLDGGRDDN
ncbi:PAS domain-containing protein [Aquamicrobium segne]|uniref:PAS domain-containing protein n=1 Tax=Aquamicrobium segne TaxID=469547 RepID=A0ABW0GXG6_9HYPH